MTNYKDNSLENIRDLKRQLTNEAERVLLFEN